MKIKFQMQVGNGPKVHSEGLKAHHGPNKAQMKGIDRLHIIV